MNADTSQDSGIHFQMLHPSIQEQLYSMRWRVIRPIQKLTIREVRKGTGHLIIAAPTAGGKTEAAFLPILSQIMEDHEDGVRVIYAGPLKALINDQFRRLEDLCDRTGIQIHKWHGDVGSAAKKALREKPSGILLITPESIESLFVNHADRLDAMFGRLAFAVIDELHSFIGTERGAHLRSLLCRLSRKSRQPVRWLGLSATFGENGDGPVRRWLEPRDPDHIHWLDEPSSVKAACPIAIKAFLRRIADQTDDQGPDSGLTKDLFQHFYGHTALIFGNNKTLLEDFADRSVRQCRYLKLPDLFRVHHGSLSKPEREDTEEALRSDSPTATFCSSTLELGIDVGEVKLVGQIGTPWSVGSLTQRIGRSGRKEGTSQNLTMFIEEDEPSKDTSLVDRLFPTLLQGIAMTELFLANWCEPPQVDRLHASTLVQQVLSVVKEYGGARAERLYELLVSNGGFNNVDELAFVEVLRCLGHHDLLEQTPQGELILGLKGERIVNNKDFYIAFQTPEEFRVIHQGRLVGSVAVVPSTHIDHYLILAGRRWKLVEVNVERREILVVPSQGGRLPIFRGSGGPDIHPQVRQTIRHLLLSDLRPTYLDCQARELLARARSTANNADLANRNMVSSGTDVLWFTWTGTRINRTLVAFARHMAELDVSDDGIALCFEGNSQAEVVRRLRQHRTQLNRAEEIAALVPNKALEKYEGFLSENLQNVVFARNSLDLEGARQLLDTV